MTTNSEPAKAQAQTHDDEPVILRWLSRFEISLAGVFLLTMIVGVLWQVLGRYVQAVNWAGAGEIARYSLVGLTFIMVGYLIGKNGQITVAVIDNIVRGRGAMIVRFVSAFILAVLCAVLLWEAWSLFSTGFQRTTTVLQIPLGFIFLFPLFGFVSGTIRAIVKIFNAPRPEQSAITFEDAEA